MGQTSPSVEELYSLLDPAFLYAPRHVVAWIEATGANAFLDGLDLEAAILKALPRNFKTSGVKIEGETRAPGYVWQGVEQRHAFTMRSHEWNVFWSQQDPNREVSITSVFSGPRSPTRHIQFIQMMQEAQRRGMDPIMRRKPDAWIRFGGYARPTLEPLLNLDPDRYYSIMEAAKEFIGLPATIRATLYVLAATNGFDPCGEVEQFGVDVLIPQWRGSTWHRAEYQPNHELYTLGGKL